MAFFKEELSRVKALIFDVDGVLSLDVSPLNEEGDPVRTANVKDGYAIRTALNSGLEIAIITGGAVERVKLRYNKLGVKHIYMGTFDKVTSLTDFVAKTGIQPDEILYMGDDIVDIPILQAVGLPTCPVDAVPEVKSISKYISDKKGGEGCARDVIEQVLKAQDKWLSANSFYWRAT